MGNFFSIDSKFYRFLDKLADCLILNALWLLFCLPIFTIGAANTALYYTAQKSIRRDEGGVWSVFWRTFRSNFKQSTLLWIVFLLIFALLGFDYYFAYLMKGSVSAMGVFCIVIPILLALAITWSIYCFAYVSHIEDPLKTVFKNSFLICIANLPKSFLIAVGYIVCLLLFAFLPIGPLLLFLLPVLYMYFLVCPTLEKVFGKYWNMTPDEEV